MKSRRSIGVTGRGPLQIGASCPGVADFDLHRTRRERQREQHGEGGKADGFHGEGFGLKAGWHGCPRLATAGWASAADARCVRHRGNDAIRVDIACEIPLNPVAFNSQQ